MKSSPRREPDVPSDLFRALFGNVTEPRQGVGARHAAKNALKINLQTRAPALPKILSRILGFSRRLTSARFPAKLL
jgi:hypothetical protein